MGFKLASAYFSSNLRESEQSTALPAGGLFLQRCDYLDYRRPASASPRVICSVLSLFVQYYGLMACNPPQNDPFRFKIYQFPKKEMRINSMREGSLDEISLGFVVDCCFPIFFVHFLSFTVNQFPPYHKKKNC